MRTPTPTPRTFAGRMPISSHSYKHEVVHIDTAIALETDLAAAQLLLKVESDAVTEQGKTISSLQADLAAARAEVERLKVACDKFSNAELSQGDWKARAERAEAEVVALREDKARLDWLEEYIVAISRLTSPDMSGIRFVGQVHNPLKATPDYPAGTPTYLKIQGQTVRAAIDALNKEAK